MDSLKLISDKTLGKRGTKNPSNKVTGKNFFAVALLLATFALTSCVTLPDPETTQDFSTHVVATVEAEQTVGQTFISRRARLNGIDLWFKPSESALLTVELYQSHQDHLPLYSGVIRAKEGRTRIPIPVQEGPPGQTYYLKLSTDQGVVNIYGRNEDNYIHGEAFINNQPILADLAFQVTYEYTFSAVLTDFTTLFSRWQWFLPLVIMLLLPGWLILDFTGWKENFDIGERLAMALGLSLAIVPLLMVWTSFIGIQWGRITVWVVVIILVAIQTTRWTQPSQKPRPDKNTPDNGIIPEPEDKLDEGHPSSISNLSKFSSPAFGNHLSNFLLICIFGFALLLRFAMVRDLAAPAWVDSIHHGLITRLILEQGGLPESFSPFIPPGAESYHSGFHSNLATYVWLTDLEIHTAMQFFGQVLNALMVFPIYLLTKKITGSRPAGLSAALVVTAFTLMPVYYASWGRYTHLTGLLVLPAAFVSATQLLKSSNFRAISPKDWGMISGPHW